MVFNLIMTLLSISISALRNDVNGQLSESINSFGIVLGCIVSGSVFVGEVIGLGDSGLFGKVAGVYDLKLWYVPFFLIKTVLFSLILQYGMLYSFNSYVTNAAAGLVFFYFLFILLLRPYKNSIISNLSVIVNEAIVIHSFLLADLKRFITIDEST